MHGSEAVHSRPALRGAPFSLLVLLLLSVGVVQAARPTQVAVSVAGHAARSCPPARGTATVSDWQAPDTLNPYQSNRLVTTQVTNAILEHLFRYDSGAHLQPQMATVVPTVQNGGIKDGGRTVIVHLRKGLRWSNGSEITARDLWFGWRIGMDPASGPDCLGSCDAIRRIDISDRYTVTLRLKGVNSSAVPSAMPDVWPSVWRGAWHDPHTAATRLYTDPTFTFEGPGFPTNGPYQVGTFSASRIALHPMKYYAGQSCGARLRSLAFTSYGSKDDVIAAAAKRQTDVTTGYSLADLPDLAKHRSAYRIRARTSFTFEHLEFNLASRYAKKPNPLADSRVRLALALALDKYQMIHTSMRAAPRTAQNVAAWSPFVHAGDLAQPGVPNAPVGQWDPLARKFVVPGSRMALADARTLLKRAHFKAGFSLDLYTTAGSTVRQSQEAVIATAWSKLGVKVDPHYLSASKLLAPWNQGGVLAHSGFQVAMLAYVGSPDPAQYRFNLQSRYCNRTSRAHTAINGNNVCVHDSLIDRSFDEAVGTLRTDTRAADYAIIQLQINKQAYWDPLYFWPVIATDDGKISNVSLSPTQQGATWNIGAWKAGR